MLTLGIETSCDETAAALVEGSNILSSEVSSSVELHSPYGGVVPEIASRFHVEYIDSVVSRALRKARRAASDLDLVAVTSQPGLAGSLLIGEAFARAVSYAGDLPFVEINHLHAHIVSCFIGKKGKLEIKDKFPFIGMVISGGHTSIFICRSIDDFEQVGRTRDDAAGEAFDKVAKMMNLGYPGGPYVEKRAARYKSGKRPDFPRSLLGPDSDLDFSFSGIKTAVMYYWKNSSKSEREKDKICFSFQKAVIDVLEEKLLRAVRFAGIRKVAVGGGVVNNKTLRKTLMMRCEKEKVGLYLPHAPYCGDNAAMVAALGELKHKALSVKRNTLHVSRFTFHASRFTFHERRGG